MRIGERLSCCREFSFGKLARFSQVDDAGPRVEDGAVDVAHGSRLTGVMLALSRATRASSAASMMAKAGARGGGAGGSGGAAGRDSADEIAAPSAWMRAVSQFMC